jgi:hypothetical protein
MPNVSSFGAQTDNSVVQGTVTDRAMVIPDVPPQGLMSVGPRVTPHFVKPSLWSALTTYHFFDAVHDAAGASYVAIKPEVPAGTELTDEGYWFLWADPNSQFADLSELVKTFNGRITQNTNDIATNKAVIEQKISGKYDTLSDLISSDVKIGSIYYVTGRKTTNVGGGFYKIVNNETVNGYENVSCGNNLVASLVPMAIITPEQIEPLQPTDWADTIMHAIDYANANDIQFTACGTYDTAKTIVFNAKNDNLNVKIDGTINYTGTDYAIKIKNKISSFNFNVIKAPNGSGIALDQTTNDYQSLVQGIALTFNKITALENGVAFLAGNHGVLDIEIACNISITAKNCYYANAGTGNTSNAPSYTSEVHVHGGRLNGSEFAINLNVANGFEITGHTYTNFSAEGSNKLINLNAGPTNAINTIVVENARIAEIGKVGLITATGNVRECVFRFPHYFELPWFTNKLTTYKTRGNYVYAPINVTGSLYTGFNCAYFAGDNKFQLLQPQSLKESNITESYSWNTDSTTEPVYFFKLKGTIDVSAFGYLSENGLPLYFKSDKDVTIKNGEKTLFDGPSEEIGTYAIIKTNLNFHVLKL